MSHSSARVEMPRFCCHQARGDGKGRAAPQKQLTPPLSACQALPRHLPHPHRWGLEWPGHISGLGTSVAQGQLCEPWKSRQEFAFLFALPNCACGFPGAAAGSGFHGRFCADLENRGRHKGATMDLPLTRIKGGRRGGPGAPRTGHRSLSPRHRQHRGTPGAGGAGGWWPTRGDTRGSSGGDMPLVRLLDGGVEPQPLVAQRQQLLRARRKWCKSWTQMFPLFSFPVIFS